MATIRLTRTCVCGATSAQLDLFDAELISNLFNCSDACKAISDARNSWSEIYG